MHTCHDLCCRPLQYLQGEFGEKTGETLHFYARGEDSRTLENKPRQTLGADINWGIRFSSQEEVARFLREFSEEVYDRLVKSGYRATHVTVNAKKRLYEGEPTKFLGCGHCEDISRSTQLSASISSATKLFEVVSTLYKQIGLKLDEVRGVGIHLKKLSPATHAFTSSSTSSTVGKQGAAMASANSGGLMGADVSSPSRSAPQRPQGLLEASPEDHSPQVQSPDNHRPSRAHGLQTSIFAFARPLSSIASAGVSTSPNSKEASAKESLIEDESSDCDWQMEEDRLMEDLESESRLFSPEQEQEQEQKQEREDEGQGDDMRPQGPEDSPCRSPVRVQGEEEVAICDQTVDMTSDTSPTSSVIQRPVPVTSKSSVGTKSPVSKPHRAQPSLSSPIKKNIAARSNKVEKRRDAKTITSFFHPVKQHLPSAGDGVCGKEEYLLQGVDLSVWGALPEEIRKEQLEVLRESKRRKH